MKFGPVIVDFVPTTPSASVYSGAYLSARLGTFAVPGVDSLPPVFLAFALTCVPGFTWSFGITMFQL